MGGTNIALKRRKYDFIIVGNINLTIDISLKVSSKYKI